jgi:mediator of RNA polymerase II transcription subunit 4
MLLQHFVNVSEILLRIWKKKIIISELPASQQNQFAWHPSGEIHMTVGGQGSVSMDTRNHTTEDVEVMSTDSSSSSSSDSQ